MLGRLVGSSVVILIKNIYTSNPDQEYIYCMGSESLPSTYYILSDKYRIPF